MKISSYVSAISSYVSTKIIFLNGKVFCFFVLFSNFFLSTSNININFKFYKMATRPQPRVRNYNPIRIMWTDEQCEYLLDQRMYRNSEYWNLGSGGKERFWRNVARKINSCFGTSFTGDKVSAKWKNLRNDHVVSIFMIINILLYICFIYMFIYIYVLFFRHN